MPRVKKDAAEQKLLRNAALMRASVGEPKKKRTSVKARSGQLERLMEQVEHCIESEDWGDKRPALLVGVFAWAHEQVYGVSVVSELKRSFLPAINGAKRLMEEEFNGDFDETLTFMRWAWARESDREEWRRKNTGYGKRLKWRSFFQYRDLVTEMRLAEARVGGGVT